MEDVVGFLLYLGIFYQPIGASPGSWRISSRRWPAPNGSEVLKRPEVKEKKHPAILKKVEGKITFDRVSFAIIMKVRMC